MKNLPIALLVALFACSCQSGDAPTQEIPQAKEKIESVQDTTPRVTGIGGIFFLSENPQAIREWYGSNLGLAIDDFGSPFEFRNANRPDEVNYLRWSPFEQTSDHFQPSQKPFMINYRVHNMEALVRKLQKNGVTILGEIESFDYGKFVHILDPEGNKIELWEPIDGFFSDSGIKTTK